MVCKKCGSENVLVTTEQVSAKTSARGNGCLYSLVRYTLIFCTCGVWLLVGRRKGSGNTKIKNRTVCICQSCGYKWYK